MTKEIGFTLVEVMVTLLIVSILVAIAVPSFTQLIRRSEANGETNRILSLLALARSESIKKSQVAYLMQESGSY